jgi:hypothetical protein
MASTAVNGFFPRVSLGFARKIDTDLIAFVRNIVTLLTGSTQYPTPLPPLATITTSVDAFESAVQEALDGGKIAIASRNAARAALLSLVRQLAAYVQGNCAADLVNIFESGFDATRAPSPVGVPAAPDGQRLGLTGMSGELLMRYDKVSNAVNYTVESATSPEGPWTFQALVTQTRVTIQGLTPGKVYWARARANGSAGSGEWGGPATAMAV